MLTSLHSLLLHNNERRDDNIASSTSSSSAVSKTTPDFASQLYHQQQAVDLMIGELRRHGVALIDIRGYTNIRCNVDIHDPSIGDTRNSHSQDENCDTNVPTTAFATARRTLDQLHQQQQQQQQLSSEQPLNNTATACLECPIIIAPQNQTNDQNSSDKNPSAAHVFGYHPSGGMISTRYNMYREGFVFSDRHVTFDVRQKQEISSTHFTTTSFGNDCYQMFTLLHTVADTILSNIGQHLQLPGGDADTDLFQNNYIQDHFGPTIHYSQWHLKRYTNHNDDPLPMSSHHRTKKVGPSKDDPVVLLPSHTDPSLISVIILDRPDIQSGAMGLQYFQRDRHDNDNTNDHDEPSSSSSSRQGEWVDVPCSGHDVAIVLVGSILQYITNGYFTAVKHRVVRHSDDHSSPNGAGFVPGPEHQRMAATLFCRPKPSAVLGTLPSPMLFMAGRGTPPLTFEEWMAKTAKNYQKAKLHQSQHSHEKFHRL